jgi:hypothetical protein
VVVVAEPEPRSNVPARVTGVAAVVLLGGAAALGVLAFSARSELARGSPLPDGRTASALTGTQAQDLSQRANLEFIAGSAAAGLGLALGVTTVILW